METLLVKAANGDDYEAEFKFLEASYREDVDTGALPGHATKYSGTPLMRPPLGHKILVVITRWSH